MEIRDDMIVEIIHMLREIPAESEHKKRAVDMIWEFEEMQEKGIDFDPKEQNQNF